MGDQPDLSSFASLRDWEGRRESVPDVLHPTPVRALATTLDLDGVDADDGAPLPPLWHWLYFLPLTPTSGLGPDGHARRGGFLPPVPLERRMWAGGRLTFHHPLHLGEQVERTSQIVSVSPKRGRAGPIVLVTVSHTVTSTHGVAVQEEQDLVYVAMPTSFTPPPADPLPDGLEWCEERRVDPVVLFRFSALTFNAHRIHYDLRYSTEVEHYPGLVVHGPLQAVLLMDSAHRHRPGNQPATYGYRASRPIFADAPCLVAGRTAEDGCTEAFTASPSRDVAMRARVTWR
jgi:3-methylfumaryl-CoA hydratase